MDIYNHILQLLEKEFSLSNGMQYIPAEKDALIKKVANLLDVCWDDQDLETVELSAGTGNNALYVSLISADLVTENGNEHPLFQLSTLADTIRFSNKGGLLCMSLHFKDIIANR